MAMKKAAAEAIINGIVIGALVAAVMIFSNQVSDIIIVRTTGAAIMLRFATYMIENVDEVDAGLMGEYVGLSRSKGEAHFLSFKKLHLGKLI